MDAEVMKMIEEEKAREQKDNNIINTEEIIKNQREKDLAEISKHKGFLGKSKEINARDVRNSLLKKENEIQSEELQREWEKYLLKKKKEEQDYRTKLEKTVVKQEIQADINEQKRKIAIKRYGYLYEKDKEGTPKDFTQSKIINKFKEFNNWYKNLSENAQKSIITTAKFVIKIGFFAVIGVVVYFGFKWLINSGVLNII